MVLVVFHTHTTINQWVCNAANSHVTGTWLTSSSLPDSELESEPLDWVGLGLLVAEASERSS